GLFQFAPPLLMGRFLAVLIGASHAAPGLQAYRELTLLFVAIALSVVAILGFQYAANRAGQWLSTVVGVDIRARLHGAVLDLGFGKQRELDAGTLQTRIVADTATIETLFSVSLPTMAIQTIFVGGAVALLVVRAPFLAPIVVVPLATVLAAALLARRATERLIAESAALAGALAARIAELGNGASAIRLSGRHAHQQRLFDDVAARAVAVQRRLWRYTGGFQHVLILNVSLCSYLMWYVGGMNALRPHGPIAVSDLIAFVPIVLLLFQPVYSLAAILDTIPKSLAAAQRIAAILDAPSEHAGGIESVPAGGSLRLEDVWFGYVDGIDVLRGCSFAVAPGEFVALTGPSGAGKSTIVNLLARLYEPRAGSVRWGHARASDIAPRSWRRAIGVVAQETFLFAESVRDNIRCGRDWIGDDAVEAAARAANADAFIRALPAGYDTPLGDAGAALSGGERQRLGIARALAGDPLLLLFDEPTAALDAETEAAFLDGLERARRGRTVVMVAHRPSAIARADRVLRLRDGRIAEGLRATRAV
ncbi:MAG: ABC transporter ATP-binding protein, partial [Candidatus Eremiobacteraeota bacterium]|nr:ABC transporter ATP-binding protein [Candidatus Eremiobacteraeota bacterium]